MRIVSWVMAGGTVLSALLASSAQTDATELRTYSNDRAGYGVSYPANWYASPPFYANAFEIRNYDASHVVPEWDEASIIISQDAAASPEDAERQIQNLLSAAARGKNFQSEQLSIGSHVLYRWTVLERTAVTAGHPTAQTPAQPARLRLRIASAVILGPQIVRMEGKTWEDADPRVIAEMKEITRSIRPHSKKGTVQ